MTGAELVRAAIEKLEHDRAMSFNGLARFSELDDALWLGSYCAADHMDPAAGKLFVTLYRTIDAQLEILRHQLPQAEKYEGRVGIWQDSIQDALTLARTILGEDTK